MVRFGYRCPAGHEIVEQHRVGQAPPTTTCYEHAHTAARVFDVPHFVEDRLRFAKASPHAPSERWSYALGREMPETRQERRRIEKERGIEFVTKADVYNDPETRKSLDYVAHLRSGGAPIPPKELDPPKPLPKGILARKLREKGVRFGADSGGFVLRTPEQVERQIRDHAPEWSEREAVTPKT
jgi:hypothetical protein